MGTRMRKLKANTLSIGITPRMDVNRMPTISLEFRIAKQDSIGWLVEMINSFLNAGKVLNEMKGKKCGTAKRIWNDTRRGGSYCFKSQFILYDNICNWRVPILISVYCHVTVITHWDQAGNPFYLALIILINICLWVFTFVHNQMLDSCSLVPRRSAIIYYCSQ